MVLKLVSCWLSCAASLLSGMLGSLGEQLRPVPGLCGIYQGHLPKSAQSPTAQGGLEWAVGAGKGRGRQRLEWPKEAIPSLFLEAQSTPQS